jgi:hypothetical protein
MVMKKPKGEKRTQVLRLEKSSQILAPLELRCQQLKGPLARQYFLIPHYGMALIASQMP